MWSKILKTTLLLKNGLQRDKSGNRQTNQDITEFQKEFKALAHMIIAVEAGKRQMDSSKFLKIKQVGLAF